MYIQMKISLPINLIIRPIYTDFVTPNNFFMTYLFNRGGVIHRLVVGSMYSKRLLIVDIS
jgi:hypothetical protein